MKTIDNAGRRERARAAIAAGSDNDSLESDVIDTLANIMHLCDGAGIDFDDHLRIARTHFNAEV